MKKVDLNNTEQLQSEFEAVRMEMNEYHDRMQFYLEAYESNVYYKPKPNSPIATRVGVNLLQAFADKNWFYLSQFPKINVPALPEMREESSKVEKILYGSHNYNDTPSLWSQLTFDSSVMSAAVVVTDVEYKKRRVCYYRIDPRRAYWKASDAQGTGIEVFWSAVPMRKSAILREYGVDVSGVRAESLDYWKEYDRLPSTDSMMDDPYYLVIRRVDHETLVMWVGDKFLMTPHKHKLPCMPVDVALPLRIASSDYRGDFFLRRLVDLQCEFNEQWRQRANIVRRLGNPAIWGRNINNNQMQDVKSGLSMDGGFIGLKENGELGLLTVPNTEMIDKALQDTYSKMMDVAGFPPAAFGSVAGANTSADALGMYYQPTTRQIEHQNTRLGRLLQDINRKTLMLYKFMLRPGEEVELESAVPNMRKYARDGAMYNTEGNFDDTFTRDDIVTLRNIVTTATVTPKDDIAYKRLMFEMARDGVVSKTTALDEIGFLSPQDEIDLLSAETSSPELNPDGASKMTEAAASMLQAQNAGMVPPEEGVPTNAMGSDIIGDQSGNIPVLEEQTAQF